MTRDETGSCVFPFVILEVITVRTCWIMDGLRLTLALLLVFLMNRDEATAIGGSSGPCLLWACFFFYNQVPPRVAAGVSWAREYHVSSFKWNHWLIPQPRVGDVSAPRSLRAILKMIRQNKETDGSLQRNRWQINLHITDQPLFVRASQTSNQEKKERRLLMTETIKTVHTNFTGPRKTHHIVLAANLCSTQLDPLIDHGREKQQHATDPLNVFATKCTLN